MILSILLTLNIYAAGAQNKETPSGNIQKGAPLKGLKMYYEVQGSGEPLLLLHGAYMTLEGPMREMAASLSKTRKVIMVELQGHGRTADTDRPITTEFMAEDVAALLQFLKVPHADVFGYSMGGGVALQLVLRYPEKVRKLIIASTTYSKAGMYPELLEMIPQMTAEVFEGLPIKKTYDSVAPNPKDFPKLVSKVKQLEQTNVYLKTEQIKAIKSPTMIIIGDSDATKPEHAVEMFRLLGGGVMGDLAGLPNSQLAILPATTHMGLMSRLNWVIPMMESFLNEPAKTTSN